MEKIFFIVFLLTWLLIGFIGLNITNETKHKINFPLVLFLIFIPFIPIIAHFCGL